ncbi:MAG: CpaE family protein [Bdellovibrionales bacterium]
MGANGDPANIVHSDFIAFVGDDATHDVVRAYAESVGFPSAVVQQGDIGSLTTLVEQSQVLPKIILIDIDGVDDALPRLVRVIEALDGISKIIAIGSTNDVNLFRGLLSAGAADYVIKPLTAESVTAAFRNAEKQISGDNPAGAPQAGRIVTFIGVRGGVGTSTIAINTAWLLAHRLNMHTAFFDLDLQFGTAALALDLVPGRGLREALETPGRLDSLLIASSMVPESDRLSLLSTEEPVEDNVACDGGAASAIAADLKKNFAFALVDLPRHRMAGQKKLLAESDIIILVAEQTLAAIRDVVRIKGALKTIAPNARVMYVMSRISPAKAGERAAQVDQPTFERAIQDKITIIVPEDPGPVAHAANRGQSLGKVAPGAGITRAILQLAELLTGRRALQPKQGMLSRFIPGLAPKGGKKT